MMMAALVLTSAAFISVTAAYVGEWWTTVQYPDDFPNRPETDRGFRILMVYWMTCGSPLLLLGAVAWILGLFFYAYAGLSRRACFLSSPGQWCSVMHVILGSYVLWVFLSRG
jgi:hypothetical protein